MVRYTGFFVRASLYRGATVQSLSNDMTLTAFKASLINIDKSRSKI